MKVLMKKLCGFSLPNLIMPLNLSPISIWLTLGNLVLYPLLEQAHKHNYITEKEKITTMYFTFET